MNNHLDYRETGNNAHLLNLIDDTLGEDSRHIYQFTTGFLDGSSFVGNKACGNSLGSITYYGLMVIEDLQEFQSLNPIKATQTLPQFTLHSNKLQEAYAGLSTSCDINHITDTFSGLLAFTAQDWVRQGARIIGVLISLVTGGLKELLSSFSSGDYEKAGFLTGKYF